jgi:hypothetical protein
VDKQEMTIKKARGSTSRVSIKNKKDIFSCLEGKRLNGYVLQVNNVCQGRFMEETNFELYLKAKKGVISEKPVVRGKYFYGRGESYKPWLEIYYENLLRFKSLKTLDLTEKGLDEKLFKYLTNLLPPGSHIMVVYLNHEEISKGLMLGIPAPATYIGYLLWKTGFTWFKDWYFAEGFLEGDVKLQGNKPMNQENRRKNLLKIRKELTKFLEKEKRKEKFFLDVRKRARDLLKHIESEVSRDE